MELIPFGDLIKRAREAKGYTKQQMADSLAWPLSAITRIETNQVPTPNDEASLYAFFGVLSFQGLVKKYGTAKKKTPRKMTPQTFIEIKNLNPDQIEPFLEIVKVRSTRGQNVFTLTELNTFWMILLSLPLTKIPPEKPSQPNVVPTPAVHRFPYGTPSMTEPEAYVICRKCRKRRLLKNRYCPEDGTPL